MPTAPELTVTGQFRPPAMGQVVAPIPVTGDGSLSATAQGLRVQGTRAPPRVGLALGIRAAVVLVLANWTIFTWWRDHGMGDPGAPAWPGVVLLGTCAILTLDGVRLLRAARAARGQSSTVEMLVPWNCIRGIRRNEVPFRHGPPDTETVILIIRDFQPSGGLYFVPSSTERMAQLEACMRANNVSV